MNAPVRVGVVGTSWWTEGMYLPSLTSHPDARVVALCGRGRARAEELAGRFGVPHVFADYGEMIDRGGLDALAVATPDDLHHPMTLRALRAGLHVLCEKPLASNRAQALEMWRAAEAAGVVHLVLFMFRWLPAFRQLEKLVTAGYVGRIHHAEFHYLSGSGRTDTYGWRFDRQRANGVLGDVGSHLIDLAHALVGPITRVSARLAIDSPRQAPPGGTIDPANDVALLQVEFEGGAVGLLQTSCVAHVGDRGMQQRVALYGTTGRWSWRWPTPVRRGVRGCAVRGRQAAASNRSTFPTRRSARSPTRTRPRSSARNPWGRGFSWTPSAPARRPRPTSAPATARSASSTRLWPRTSRGAR